MSECFVATEGELKPHWNTLESELKQVFRTAEAKGKILSSPVGSQIIAVFMGADARRAGRLRGDPIPVVLLSSVGSGWDAWIGLRESWRHTSGNKYRFSSADITVFFSVSGSEQYQQVLRAEWMGPETEGDELAFKPHDAGHPHWQIDIAEALKQDPELAEARQLLLHTEPKEFGEAPQKILVDPPWYQFGRMHLASSMQPWMSPAIAHSPTKLSHIRSWTLTTVNLIRLELARFT